MNCGKCTLCCKLPQIVEVNSPKGKLCEHCESGIGCKIYDTRPSECREYQCMWSQMEHVGAELRPDICNVIFEKVSERAIVADQDPLAQITPIGWGQIEAFRKQGFSVLLIRGYQQALYLAPEHDSETIMKDIHDRAKLYGRPN